MSRQRTKTEIMRREHYFTKLIENAENAMREYQQERGGNTAFTLTSISGARAFF